MVGGAGWQGFGPDARISRWADAARAAAETALLASDEARRCGGTWTVGLDLLPNASDGSVGGVALPTGLFGLAPQPLHRAQVSAVYPCYPRPDPDESPAAFAYRLTRDAAHLDGLLPIGPNRARMIREPHGYILGIALGDSAQSPLVVWEGSHLILRRALAAALAAHDPSQWAEVDVTAAYHAARREVFANCPRREIVQRRGEAVLLHRHLLHGVAPWVGEEGPARLLAYFRPLMPSVQDWIAKD